MNRSAISIRYLILFLSFFISVQSVKASCISRNHSSSCVWKVSVNKEIWIVEISRRSAGELKKYIGFHDNDVMVALNNIISDMGERYKSVGFTVDVGPLQKKVSDCQIYPIGPNSTLDKNVTNLTYLSPRDCTSTALKLRRFVRRLVTSNLNSPYFNVNVFADYLGYKFQQERLTMYMTSTNSSKYAYFEAYTPMAVGGVLRGIPLKSYTLRKGDTLWDVAKNTVGDGAAWPAFYDLNASKLTHLKKLKEGDSIYLPPNISGWWDVAFQSTDAKSISKEVYGTSDYGIIIETLCRPLLMDTGEVFTCILPMFDNLPYETKISVPNTNPSPSHEQ